MGRAGGGAVAVFLLLLCSARSPCRLPSCVLCLAETSTSAKSFIRDSRPPWPSHLEHARCVLGGACLPSFQLRRHALAQSAQRGPRQQLGHAALQPHDRHVLRVGAVAVQGAAQQVLPHVLHARQRRRALHNIALLHGGGGGGKWPQAVGCWMQSLVCAWHEKHMLRVVAGGWQGTHKWQEQRFSWWRRVAAAHRVGGKPGQRLAVLQHQRVWQVEAQLEPAILQA